jgi:hypothetical protein
MEAARVSLGRFNLGVDGIKLLSRRTAQFTAAQILGGAQFNSSFTNFTLTSCTPRHMRMRRNRWWKPAARASPSRRRICSTWRDRSSCRSASRPRCSRSDSNSLSLLKRLGSKNARNGAGRRATRIWTLAIADSIDEPLIERGNNRQAATSAEPSVTGVHRIVRDRHTWQRLSVFTRSADPRF